MLKVYSTSHHKTVNRKASNMEQKRVLAAVLVAVWSAFIAVLAAYIYTRKLLTDVTDLMEGLQKYVETFVRG